jgi:hypothetical protein
VGDTASLLQPSKSMQGEGGVHRRTGGCDGGSCRPSSGFGVARPRGLGRRPTSGGSGSRQKRWEYYVVVLLGVDPMVIVGCTNLKY